MKLNVLTLVLFSCGLVYAALFKGGVWPSDWHISLVLIGAGSLVFWLSPSSRHRIPKLDRWLCWPVLLLPSYVLFQLLPLPPTVLSAISPERAEQLGALQPIVKMEFAPLSVLPAATVEYFFRILAYLSVVITVRAITWLWSDRRWTVAIPVLVLGTAEAALGMFQVAENWPNGTARGTYVNRDHFAGLLEMTLPLAIMYAVAVWSREDRKTRSRALPALAAAGLAGLAGLMLLGIIYSLSRMGFLVALCSLFVLTLLSVRPRVPSRRWLGLAMALIGISAILLFVLLPPDQLIARFADMASTDKISADDRLQMWRESVGLIRAYPWFGCGLGGFESAFGRFQVSLPTFTVDYAHNDYLQSMAELGVVGATIAAAFVGAVLSKAIRATGRQEAGDGRYLAIGCLGSIIAMLLHSLVDFNLQIPANSLVLAWISGISLGLADQLTTRDRASRNRSKAYP
jgi:O-antigen ligase